MVQFQESAPYMERSVKPIVSVEEPQKTAPVSEVIKLATGGKTHPVMATS